MGTRTASGERFDPMGITAAHPSLPFGTKVRVTHAGNGQSVVVRINDRGPFGGGRVIDLSLGAARQIGLHMAGIAKVKLEVLGSSADAAIAAALPQPGADADTATPEPAGVLEPVTAREPLRRLAVERLGGPTR
jgi:rare lipoprotein A